MRRHALATLLFLSVPVCVTWAALGGGEVRDSVLSALIGYAPLVRPPGGAGFLLGALSAAILMAVFSAALFLNTLSRLADFRPPSRSLLRAALASAAVPGLLAALWFTPGDAPWWPMAGCAAASLALLALLSLGRATAPCASVTTGELASSAAALLGREKHPRDVTVDVYDRPGASEQLVLRNRIALWKEWLDRLDRRDVDPLMARQLAHRSTEAVALAALAYGFFCAAAAAYYEPRAALAAVSVLLVIGAESVMLYVAWCGRQADRAAVRAAGGAELLVTAWGRACRATGRDPLASASLLTRARRTGVAESRIRELLAAGSQENFHPYRVPERVRVECTFGGLPGENPQRFYLHDHVYQAEQILKKWNDAGGTYFHIRADDGNSYLLCHPHHFAGEAWTLDPVDAQATVP